MLRINLFGPPTLYNEDKLITIPRRMTRALLYYLAAQGKPVSRDHLVDHFWPDEPLDKARASLRDNLGKIRSALPDKNLLQTMPDLVSLDFRQVWVDLLEIQSTLEKINQTAWKLPPNTALPAELHRHMLRLVDLWSGQAFLPGGDLSLSEDLDDWMREIDDEVLSDILRVLKRLSAHDAASGNPEQAIKWMWMALPFAELDDEVHQIILENYLATGNQKEARSYYDTLKKNYDEAGETFPRRLRILEGRIHASQSTELLLPADWNVRQSLQSPFIGQSETLEELNRAYRMGGGVIIFGETGAGKTRLVQEFYRRQVNSPRLMLAACQPLEASMPFAPWMSLLRNSVLPEEWKKIDRAWVGALSLLLPDLAEIRGERAVTPQEKPDVSRAALLQAIHQILNVVSERNPIILFMDDVHWADESTLAIVAYLLREEFFSKGRGLLVMAARIEASNSLLDKFVLTSYPQPVRRLELRSLNLGEVAELSEMVLTRSLPFTLLERLEEDTGGNPFFLLEILSRLQETLPVDIFDSAEDLPLPGSIHDLIKERLASLNGETREILSAAAVMGSSFEMVVLERAVSASPEVLTEALEDLERARLIRPMPGDRPGYAFIHEKIRESLLQELSSARLRMLNKKCAVALEEYLGDHKTPYAAKLALHYEAAGDLVKAFDFWKDAGKNAYRLSSLFECLDAYRRAERLIPRALGLGDQQIYNLYVGWLELSFENDDPAELERIAQTLLTIGRERGSDLLTGAAYCALGDAHMARNQFDQAYQSIQTALTFVARTGHSYELSRVMLRHGVYLYMLGQVSESQEWFERVLQQTNDAGDPNLVASRASANYQMSVTQNLRGYPLRAIDYARKALDDYEYCNVLYGKVSAYSSLGLAQYLCGNYVAGREACQQGLVLGDRVEGWRMVGYLDTYCAMCETELGLIGDAWKHAQHAIELGRRYGHGEIVGLGFRVLGDIHMNLRHYRKAAQAYEQGKAAAADHFVQFENLYRYGLALVMQGDANGMLHISTALDITAQHRLGMLNLFARYHELAALVVSGEMENFEQKAASYREQVQNRHGQDSAFYTIGLLRARYLLRVNQAETVLGLLDEIIQWCSGKNMRWFELEALTLYALALQQSGGDVSEIRARVLEILDWLEADLGGAPILGEWQAFWSNYEWVL